MAFHILPAAEPKRSFSSDVGKALGGALNEGIKAYGEHQKQKRFGEALRGVEDIYSNPELSQEQKFIKSFSRLKEFPDAAKQFTSGLSQFAESPLQKAQREKIAQETGQLKEEENYFSRLMKGDQEEQEPSGDYMDMVEEEEAPSRKTPSKPKFDYRDPGTWTDKQIDKFRSVQGKTQKAKTFAQTAQNEYDRRKETKKASAKYQESVAPLEGALEVLGEMEKLGKKGNLGVGTRLRNIYSPETRKDSAQYERFGKSLISFASNIPIRNRAEFETLAGDLHDPSISDDARDGILTAMKKIIQNSMKSFTPPEEEGKAPKSEKKERRPLTIFLK